ncbi:MAG: Mu-like prophage major head subunit gpT family protein [Xanthomonadales bacterium]|nr:Mu-like prophage major head subunit gpT family protein [Xanthomonadales bacterium]
MKPVPAEGILGERALREAKTTEYSAINELVSLALAKSLGREWVHVCALYPDRVILRDVARLFAYPYTVGDDNQVSFGTPVEVVLEHAPVALREALRTTEASEQKGQGAGRSAGTEGCFIEALADAQDKPKNRYLVRVIRAGLSGNNVNYPAKVLRESVALFNGARVFAKSDEEHTRGKGKDVRQLVGRLVESRFVETKGGGEVQAVLEVLESSDMAAKLRESVERGMSDDLFGLSIDATGTSKQSARFTECTSIKKVESVDLIVEPGAGGQIIRFVEAQQEGDSMLRQQMLHAIGKRNKALATQLADASDDEILTRYTEAMSQPNQDEGNGTGTGTEAIEARFATMEARGHARATLAASKLPQASRDRLTQRFTEAQSLTVAEVDAAIKAESEYVTRLTESAHVRGLGEGRVEAGEDRADKVKNMLDDFFDPKKKAMSFRECYVEITGDRDVTGLLENCDRTRLREAVGEALFREAISASTFSDILGDSITRSMIREYRGLEAYGDWRWIVDIVPIRDFRTNERTRMGGYGNLPAVAENGAYDPLTSPGDDKASYAVSKRGGTETISIETIANDDVGVIRRIPIALATAAGRTLYEFVYDFLSTNPMIYDGVALFHAGHSNLGAAALDATSFAAARLRMKRQQELTSGKRLGVGLKHLVVPSDLEEAAFNLFVRNTNQDETFINSRKPTVHVVDHWTDANNWFATADKSSIPMIELGFYGGNEEPQIFIQDNPTQGSLFSNDQIKYKIRHVYGGTVVEFRGLDGSIVA